MGAASCTDDELDLCDDQEETTTTNDQETSSARRTPFSVLPFLLLASGMIGKHALMVLPLLGAPLVVEAATSPATATCGALKAVYKKENCCGNPDQELTDVVVTAKVKTKMFANNPCRNAKPIDGSVTDENGTTTIPAGYFNNEACIVNGVVKVLEQAGADITAG